MVMVQDQAANCIWVKVSTATIKFVMCHDPSVLSGHFYSYELFDCCAFFFGGGNRFRNIMAIACVSMEIPLFYKIQIIV